MYKLNLFKSSFETGAKHLDKSSTLALWNNPQVVNYLHRDSAGRPSFLLHDGPPYANGDLHLGHFVNKSLKDALLKFKRLDGMFAPFVPGFDCHGLPVELEVEKLGHAKTDPAAFVDACRSYAAGQVDKQTAQFQSFGVSADWEQSYRTMDPAFEAGAARAFARLPQVVKRLRPVHWCPACASSLAEAEVEYKSRQSDSVEVLFELTDEPGTFLQVWTTTPYTLPANRAVAFNPVFDYVRVLDEASSRHLVRVRRDGEADGPGVTPVRLAGRRVVSPYTKDVVPVVAADYVSTTGTGLVHLAPSFGTDDFRVGEANGLAAEHFVDDHGRFLAGPLQGLGLAAAGKAVLEQLGDLLYSRQTVQHEYPHCWRHKSPLFFKASEEWFLDLTQLAPDAVAELKNVSFVPETGRERLSSMLAPRTSWCLSRNRLWGSPLAEPGTDPVLLEQVATDGVTAWQAQGPRRTLDVWFDSGMTHELVMRARFGRSADLVLEGSDQHRGWFQSSLLTSMALHGKAPFATVLTHGFVLDEHGRKFSKSSANYEPMEKMLAKHSPDVLRLWALSQDYTRDLTMSTQSVERTGERYRKLRNTLRFCLQNTQDFKASMAVPVSSSLHAWQLVELSRLVQVVTAAAGQYDYAAASSALALYCETVSSEYFTAVKDTLYCDAADSPRRREAQTVLFQLMSVLVRLFVPLLPYTAEEAYQLMRPQQGESAPATSLELTLAEVSLPAPAELPVLEGLRQLRREVNQYVEANRDDTLKGPAQLELQVTLPTTVSTEELEAFFDCARVAQSVGTKYRVVCRQTDLARCPRCRRHRRLVESGLCNRCEQVEPASVHA